ncbi:MAG: hypothetical protein LUD02_13215 [Tannerellaceae bacterium]|nr:hypothetical protein [Tannerellaceae bacterium]
MIHSTLVPTIADEKGEIRQVPLSALLRVTQGEDLKSITAGKNGEYIPFRFYEVDKEEINRADQKADRIRLGSKFLRKFFLEQTDDQ